MPQVQWRMAERLAGDGAVDGGGRLAGSGARGDGLGGGGTASCRCCGGRGTASRRWRGGGGQRPPTSGAVEG